MRLRGKEGCSRVAPMLVATTMNLRPSVTVLIERPTPDDLPLLEICLHAESGSSCCEWVIHVCQKQGTLFHWTWLTKLANGGHNGCYRLGEVGLVRHVFNRAEVATPVVTD
jgi:hypothetical protein